MDLAAYPSILLCQLQKTCIALLQGFKKTKTIKLHTDLRPALFYSMCPVLKERLVPNSAADWSWLMGLMSMIWTNEHLSIRKSVQVPGQCIWEECEGFKNLHQSNTLEMKTMKEITKSPRHPWRTEGPWSAVSPKRQQSPACPKRHTIIYLRQQHRSPGPQNTGKMLSSSMPFLSRSLGINIVLPAYLRASFRAD